MPTLHAAKEGVRRMNLSMMLHLYRSMVTSRKIDELERELVKRGEAFFHRPASCRI
jgi:hypothetical protein